MSDSLISCLAFSDGRCIASGTVQEVALALKAAAQRTSGVLPNALIFNAVTSQPLELDLRGTLDEVRARFSAAPDGHGHEWAEPQPAADDLADDSLPRSRGRPKLGVVAREVTLLPRHWSWLGSQPGGASVALRRLVENARRANQAADGQRLAQESAYRFMTAMAGDLPGYEEAVRMLFAQDRAGFEAASVAWPADVREHARKLTAATLAEIG
ncbi:DUF2239 family protein [Paraburkholderia bonniea]|uniref:DUF2239 family protein n=1 Tax=Paraburkholderia bonniea TaxID=2152891 RepID=UPI001291CE0C|nr:DUF2239 family protein [Paraburkholderia bonniea]WJF90276.1 DUF2239 family protein [Paraburkholderia bonniea]WJF93591.1 DUF2239 family protein [Paraburkholderia bonniea]